MWAPRMSFRLQMRIFGRNGDFIFWLELGDLDNGVNAFQELEEDDDVALS